MDCGFSIHGVRQMLRFERHSYCASTTRMSERVSCPDREIRLLGLTMPCQCRRLPIDGQSLIESWWFVGWPPWPSEFSSIGFPQENAVWTGRVPILQ